MLDSALRVCGQKRLCGLGCASPSQTYCEEQGFSDCVPAKQTSPETEANYWAAYYTKTTNYVPCGKAHDEPHEGFQMLWKTMINYQDRTGQTFPSHLALSALNQTFHLKTRLKINCFILSFLVFSYSLKYETQWNIFRACYTQVRTQLH